MAAVTIYSDFGAPKIKSATVSIVSPPYCRRKNISDSTDVSAPEVNLLGHGELFLNLLVIAIIYLELLQLYFKNSLCIFFLFYHIPVQALQ